MCSKRIIIIILFSVVIVSSCRKEVKPITVCFQNDLTFRQITDQHAIVKLINNLFYIIEQSSIDTRLKPCNLSKDFQINDLQVILSGDVKATFSTDFGPCCTMNFIITKISKYP